MENEFQNFSSQTSVSGNTGALGAVFAGIFLFMLLIAVAIYAYMAITLMKIAKKTGTPSAWMAWVPILNLYLMVKVAQKPGWWFLLLFVPFLNIIFAALIWAQISKLLGKPEWLGLLILVPVANIVLPGYLAFSINHHDNQEQGQKSIPPVS